VIFVTVGYQMPFDRMVRAIDQWVGRTSRKDVYAQIGSTAFRPEYLQWTQFIGPSEFRAKVKAADLVVAHAGMGSIITAMELGKPILVMPRRGDLKETRNDHQVATARRFLEQGRIAVAFDEHELIEKLDQVDSLRARDPISSQASPQLIQRIRSFIQGEVSR